MFAPVIDGAAHNFSQDVISAFVAGQNAVGNRKRRRARVIGNHAAGKLFLFIKIFVNAHK